MENNDNTLDEKKFISKTTSYNSGPPMKIKNESTKRKSFNVNEAVKSLDLALGRLKKSKLENGDYNGYVQTVPFKHSVATADMFMDTMQSHSSNLNQGIDNASLMSMNFSHYELMRNLSHSNCNSDGAFSGTTCNVHPNPTDLTLMDEHLERYFKSVEMWTRNCREHDSSTVPFEMPDSK